MNTTTVNSTPKTAPDVASTVANTPIDTYTIHSDPTNAVVVARVTVEHTDPTVDATTISH